jgi:hypothetical protein
MLNFKFSKLKNRIKFNKLKFNDLLNISIFLILFYLNLRKNDCKTMILFLVIFIVGYTINKNIEISLLVSLFCSYILSTIFFTNIENFKTIIENNLKKTENKYKK